MTEYTTVEGHPIVVGEKYVTRGGGVVEVVEISRNRNLYYPVITNNFSCDEFGWSINKDSPTANDLMRPYIEPPKPATEGLTNKPQPTKTLHDEYTMAALSGLCAGGVARPEFVIKQAREIADEAMKARGNSYV